MVRLHFKMLAILIAAGVTTGRTNDGLSSSSSPISPHSNHASEKLLQDFGGHFRCPFAEKWLKDGPAKAAHDLLGLELDDPKNADTRRPQVRRKTAEDQPPWMGGDGGNADVTTQCVIAPGAIGAAHQAGYSYGYLSACPGTPGESSPYQWPLMWSADVEAESMAFGSDEVVFQSQGRVYYRLDRNWKRLDLTLQNGTQRAIGQVTCDGEGSEPLVDPDADPNQPVLACKRNTDRRTTMIHRGARMVFIRWAEGVENSTSDDLSSIETCTWVDLQVVGNVRPDWFMDDRGDSTDVQYLGDQHVYYNGMPRLVKQWRKKDFASQYFTMSMLANPGEDGVHWPLTLNIPGEGFGDDQLQSYSNHELLTEDDEDLFLLDEAYMAAGGSCNQIAGSGEVGPPTSKVDPIPSNLEVDPDSWHSTVKTFSPVWEPPPSTDGCSSGSNGETNRLAVTQPGSDTSVGSCFDPNAGAVYMNVTFFKDDVNADNGQNPLPWLALAFRQDEECLMTPRNGGNGQFILVTTTDSSGTPAAEYGSLPAALRTFQSDIIQQTQDNLTPLSDADGFSDVKVSRAGGSVTLSFKRTVAATTAQADVVPEAPEVMHLTYAYGLAPEFGYHTTRECFEVSEFPPCPAEIINMAANDNGSDSQPNDGAEVANDSDSSSASLSPVRRSILVVSALSTAATVVGFM